MKVAHHLLAFLRPDAGAQLEIGGLVSEKKNRRDSDRPAFELEAATARRLAAMKAAERLVDSLLSEAQRHGEACRAHLLAHGTFPGSRVALVVDDLAEMRDVYGVALRIAGFQVEEASDGFEGVERALAAPPHVIVMDFAMPGMDGGEAIQLLASDERTRHVPVVMVSAYGDAVPRGVRDLCAAFIAKPCEPDELMRQLRLVVDARASTRFSAP